MSSILTMENIKKSFGELEVIKDISVSIKHGEVLSVIGPSGGGKSTLLRCATMLETINGGSISYGDRKAAWTDEKGKVIYAKGQQMKERTVSVLYFRTLTSFRIFLYLKILLILLCVYKKEAKMRFMPKQKLCLKKWVSKRRQMLTRISCPAVSNSALPSQGHWRSNRRSCSLMNPHPHSIPN